MGSTSRSQQCNLILPASEPLQRLSPISVKHDPMDADSCLPHHNLVAPIAAESLVYRLVDLTQSTAVEQPTGQDIAGVADRLRGDGVRQIVLIHGTFAGNDIAGLTRGLSRFSPRMTQAMKELTKQWVDQLVDEVGNYTNGFATLFASLINADREDLIGVERFDWSGENHHLGRACATISLLQWIVDQPWSSKERVQFWAHSHGGNILALMTLLLNCSASLRKSFFAALQHHYRSGSVGEDFLPDWERVKSMLDDRERIAALPGFDLVTFGTPLRYRWQLRPNDRLLHFVQHRVQIPEQPYLATLPKSISDVKHAAAGDYVQQMGIGGTDFPPTLFAFNSWRANGQLKRMLEPSIRRRDLHKAVMQGCRVSLDGKTLLVDYPPQPDRLNEKIFGHGVYTCHQWLPFHLREIVNEFSDAST